MHEKLKFALDKNAEAMKVFESLSPSRRHEIVRYIAHLKSEEAREKNLEKAINFLMGKERFAGRDKP